MDEINQNGNKRRYKWFMVKKRTPKADTQKKRLSIDSNRCRKIFSMRERFHQLTSAKVNAYENELVAKLSDNTIEDDDRSPPINTVRLVSERQNLSIPNSTQFFQNISLNTEPCRNVSICPGNSATKSTNTIAEADHRALRKNNSNMDSTIKKMRGELSRYGWYWGKLNRNSAQKKLARKENGSFLVRDSQTEELFTVSFRSSGITLHCRIDYTNNFWSLSGLKTPTKCGSLIELIEDTMKKSEFGIIGYVKQNSSLTPPFPVRLTKPINRLYVVPSLQHLCRFTIRQNIDSKDIDVLPLPGKLKTYIIENFWDF